MSVMEEDIKTIIKIVKENPSSLDNLNIEQLEQILYLLRKYGYEVND